MSRIVEEFQIIDRKLGARIDELRISKGLTQEQLSKALKVSHQQLQKNIKGKNRISASRIPAIAEALNVTVSSIFEDIGTFIPLDNENERLVMEISREARKVQNRNKQYAILNLIKAINKE